MPMAMCVCPHRRSESKKQQLYFHCSVLCLHFHLKVLVLYLSGYGEDKANSASARKQNGYRAKGKRKVTEVCNDTIPSTIPLHDPKTALKSSDLSKCTIKCDKTNSVSVMNNKRRVQNGLFRKHLRDT